jgi:hypothetical protein
LAFKDFVQATTDVWPTLSIVSMNSRSPMCTADLVEVNVLRRSWLSSNFSTKLVQLQWLTSIFLCA